jgi:cell wall-associated NlpC family hydrolase
LSVDPLSKWYPFYTPYQFASNSPIIAVDVDGLESSKILNKAEQMLNTPYEFGGKKPAPELIGLLGSEEGKTFWSTLLLPGLRKISNYHPGHYKKGPGEVCTATDLYQQWAEVVKSVYQDFSTYSNKGSLGIDCSGFVNASYQEDKELLFDSKILRTGSSGQLAAFRKAEKEGKAYVHKDFNLLSEGDFIYKPDHVMIATGNVMVDESGKVISFETYEANSTDVGTVKMWRKVGKSYTIGHPFRTSDDGGGIKLEIPFIGTVTIPLPTSPSENAKQRTIDNQERKTIEVKKIKK